MERFFSVTKKVFSILVSLYDYLIMDDSYIARKCTTLAVISAGGHVAVETAAQVVTDIPASALAARAVRCCHAAPVARGIAGVAVGGPLLAGLAGRAGAFRRDEVTLANAAGSVDAGCTELSHALVDNHAEVREPE